MASYSVSNTGVVYHFRTLPQPEYLFSSTSPYRTGNDATFNQSAGPVVTVSTSDNVLNSTATPVGDGTCSGDSQLYPVPTTVILALVFAVFAIVTIAGNTLVIAAFATDRKLRSIGNYFILNLAVSDLIVGMLIAVYAPYALTGCWRLTRTGCLAFLLLDYVVPLASAWNMALISLDRYCSVAFAVEYRLRQTARRAVALMAVPWTAGVVWYGPTVLFWPLIVGRTADDDATICRVPFYDHVGYLIASSCVEFAAPFVTVTTINVLIYANIRRRTRGLMSAADTTPVRGDVGLFSKTSKAQTILSRDKRSARSLAILVVVFLVTWAPFEISAFVDQICGLCIPGSVSEIVFYLLWLNSTINPVLYPFLQQRFRVAFGRILGRVFRLPSFFSQSSRLATSAVSNPTHRQQRIYFEIEERNDATSAC